MVVSPEPSHPEWSNRGRLPTAGERPRQALHEQRVRAAGERSATETRSATSRSGSGPLPLSVSQTRLWYLNQLAPDAPACNELITIRKTGPLDTEALRRALTEVVARHEAWRTTFRTADGVPHQFVGEPTEVDLPVTDLSELGPEDAVHRATEIAAADTLRPYDLAYGPLIRPRLIRITEDDHRLYLGLHHLAFDGTTLHRVVFPELTALYRSYAMGVPSSLPDPQAQYADYTMWELDWIRGPEIAARIANSRRWLAGITPTLLPLDHPRPPCQTFAGGTIPLAIERTTVEGLRRAARTAGGTLFHALAAAYAWWLHLYADSTEVVFGSLHDLRDREDLLAVAGYCVTPVVLRCHVSGEEPFTALIGRIRRVVTEALSDVVPFDTLVAGFGVPRDPRNNPLLQTALQFEPALTSQADDWSLHVAEADVRDAVGSAKFDISIELDERPEGHLAGGFVFSTDLFDRETAREMALQWRRLLDVVAAAPGIAMAEHDLVTPDERRRQLSWNRTTRHGISSQCVHEVISSQVERTPDAVAVQIGNTTLTYRQLDDRAAVIASRLVQAGAGPGTVVAVLLDRTPDLVAAIVGVLKSGAAFLPLDPRQPASRNTFCINDVGANIVLTDRQLPTGADAVTAAVVNLSDLGPHAPGPGALSSTVSSADLAYVIYTSGSTGRPKGVLIAHRGVTNLMCNMFGEFGVGASDTVLSVASISFDLALFDVFCALACGARVVLATAAQAADPASLSRLIADSGATYMMATATIWEALVAAGWRGNRRFTVVSGGETLSDRLAEALLQRCGAVWNGYGPTEATGGTSVARLAEGDTVTVGRPLPNVRVYITDSRGRLQPVGVPGEITIGGVGVARGYLNRPDEQARGFGDDPFHVGGRIYRTGDRGRFLPDGRIQYLGRYDDQLKIRGFRIEPGEIESILCEHPDVGCCAVVAREALRGEQQLVAYIVGEPGCPSDAEARDWLRRRLPEYMVPSAFMHLSALPTTASGKLDKAALPAPAPRGPGRIGAQPPRNDTERRVAALWADLLAMPVTDVNSDFFDIGGHSQLAARLISEVQQAFGVALPLAAFLDNGRTVAQLAELLGAESRSRTDEITSGPPLHFIFSDRASAMSLRHFTAQWGAAQPVHALIPEQPGGRFDRSVTIQQHASQALSTIRNRQPDGPLALVGYSIGGLLAYEIARQAIDAGQQIDWLGVVDAPAPAMAQLLRARLTLRWQLHRLRQRPARERWAKYVEVALRVLRNSSPWPQQGFDYRGAVAIACRYQQPGHEMPIHLFVTEGSAADTEADLLGWDVFHKGTLTVDRLAGDHVTLLDLPEVGQLARMMLESLRRARPSTRVGRPVATLRGRGAK
jgi:amino acid adenylation domain-containing protein